MAGRVTPGCDADDGVPTVRKGGTSSLRSQMPPSLKQQSQKPRISMSSGPGEQAPPKRLSALRRVSLVTVAVAWVLLVPLSLALPWFEMELPAPLPAATASLFDQSDATVFLQCSAAALATLSLLLLARCALLPAKRRSDKRTLLIYILRAAVPSFVLAAAAMGACRQPAGSRLGAGMLCTAAGTACMAGGTLAAMMFNKEVRLGICYWILLTLGPRLTSLPVALRSAAGCPEAIADGPVTTYGADEARVR